MKPLVLASALLFTACVSGESPSTSASPTAPARPEPARPVTAIPTVAPAPPPEGAIAIPCTVRAVIEPKLVGDEVRLRFALVNLGDAPATVTLKATCPGGVISLQGLPANFDPMHRCQAGACVKPETTATYSIPPRGSVAIGETTLRGKGDSCNPPLPSGSTFLQAAIVTEPPAFEVCSGAMVHLVRDPTSGALRRAGLLDEPIPATAPSKPKTVERPKTTEPRKTPQPPAQPRKQCPACGFGCPNGIPSTKRGPDGCPSCTCETLEITR